MIIGFPRIPCCLTLVRCHPRFIYGIYLQANIMRARYKELLHYNICLVARLTFSVVFTSTIQSHFSLILSWCFQLPHIWCILDTINRGYNISLHLLGCRGYSLLVLLDHLLAFCAFIVCLQSLFRNNEHLTMLITFYIFS